MFDLPIAVAVNIAQKCHQRFRENIYKSILDIERSYDIKKENDERYTRTKYSLISKMCGSNNILGFIDPLIVAEYIYASLQTNARYSTTKIFLEDALLNTMSSSSTCIFNNTHNGLLGFTWANSNQERLWNEIIGDGGIYSIDEFLGPNCKDIYDLFTFYKICKKYYATEAKRKFTEFFEQKRNSLFTYKIFPEIVESYIAEGGVNERNVRNIELYRGIIDGSEEC